MIEEMHLCDINVLTDYECEKLLISIAEVMIDFGDIYE